MTDRQAVIELIKLKDSLGDPKVINGTSKEFIEKMNKTYDTAIKALKRCIRIDKAKERVFGELDDYNS